MGESLTEPKTDEAALAWHHCGRCGSLYQAPKGQGNAIACPECKRNPAPDYDSWQRKQSMLAARSSHPRSSVPRERERDRKPKKTGGKMVAKFVGVWILCLALLVVAAKRFWLGAADPVQEANGEDFKKAGDNADSLLLRESFRDCSTALNGFFEAAVPESRAQFVIDPFDAVKRLASFDSFSPLTTGDGMKKNLLAEIIHTPRGPAIETVWETKQGDALDAVFFRDKETWKIDWRELVRYSDQSWGLFLAEAGEAEGEFRLLARQRLEGEHGSQSRIGIVFYPPRFGHMREAGSPSPEFPVDLTSDDGRLLAVAFASKKAGRGPFGSHLLASDPDDLIRVRVRVRRNPEDNHQKFTLVKVIACHWFSLDEPGYDVPPAVAGHSPP